MYTIASPILALFFFAVLLAEENPSSIDPSKIKDKLVLKLGDEFNIAFCRDGDRLTHLAKPKESERRVVGGKVSAKAESAKVTFDTTSDSPFPPPSPDATRPFLMIQNNFKKDLTFRVLIRFKDEKEFTEISKDMKPILNEDTFLQCWDFETQIEEAILFDFKLSEIPDGR